LAVGARFLFEDLPAQVHAFIADEYALRPGDQAVNFVVGAPTK
jgi:hypothetical protein